MSGLNFAMALILILQSDLNKQRIAGLYFGIGEGRVYASGVSSADKNFVFKKSMRYKLFTSTSTLVPRAVPYVSSMKLLTTSTLLCCRRGSSIAPVQKENLKLDPNWVTGFVDGEGCFHVYIRKKNNSKLGWQVEPHFELRLHQKDLPVLVAIQKSLGVGKVYYKEPNAVEYRVYNFKEFEAVINNFYKYPLITKKRADYLLLIKIVTLIIRKEHLTIEGIRKIVELKAAINRGLSDKLKVAFPDVVPVVRPRVETPKAIDPQWLAGFTSAEGCFLIIIFKSKTKQGEAVKLIYQLTQHSRDQNLIQSIIINFKCGNISKNRTWIDLKVTKFDDIVEKIIPFFKKYPIQGVKALDFADWCKAVELMKEKKHLTQEGLEQIRKIKDGMNRGRKLY